MTVLCLFFPSSFLSISVSFFSPVYFIFLSASHIFFQSLTVVMTVLLFLLSFFFLCLSVIVSLFLLFSHLSIVFFFFLNIVSFLHWYILCFFSLHLLLPSISFSFSFQCIHCMLIISTNALIIHLCYIMYICFLYQYIFQPITFRRAINKSDIEGTALDSFRLIFSPASDLGSRICFLIISIFVSFLYSSNINSDFKLLLSDFEMSY